MWFRCDFNGRKRGAIGVYYWITIYIEATDKAEAQSMVEDEYEQMGSGITIRPTTKPQIEENPNK